MEGFTFSKAGAEFARVRRGSLRQPWPGLMLAVVALGWPALAQAQADPQAAAEALFRSGREAAAAGNHELACQRFKESQRLEPAAGTLLNLAVCEDRLGQFVEAWQHYHAVIDALPEGDGRRDIAKKGLSELEARLPRFVLHKAPAAPARTRVQLGHVTFEESSFDVPIPVSSGVHTWLVSAPGHETRAYTRRVAPGERLVLELAPGPPHQERERQRRLSPARPSSRSQWPLVGYSLVGIGAASWIASGVTALMVLDRGRIVDDECQGRDCTSRGLDAAQEGQSLLRWCTMTFVLGAVGLGSGTAILLSTGSPRSEGSTSFRGVSAKLVF